MKTISLARPDPPRAILLGAIGLGAVLIAIAHRWYTGFEVMRLAHGMVFILAGLVAWRLRPDNRAARLMIFGGFLLWMPNESHRISPLVYTITNSFQSLGAASIIYMMLTFPKGRVSTPGERCIFWFLVFTVLWENVLWWPFYDPRAFGCQTCPEDMNLALVKSMPELIHATNRLKPVFGGILQLLVAGVLISRWLRATRPGRRVLGPMLLPAAALLTSATVSSVIGFFVLGLEFYWTPVPLLGQILNYTVATAIFLLPLTFVLGLARARLQHNRVSRLVVELGDLPPPQRLEEVLGRALADPSLKVGVWDAISGHYVRANGETLDPPGADFGLVATRMERNGEPLALMIHDEALLDEPGLVEASAAAARLAVENDRLQAEVRAQLDEVHASRQRIVAAQDEERRRIERNLHDGAQQRLLRLSMALQVAESSIPEQSDPALRTSLDVAAEELQAVLRELRELAQGIHPAVLSQRGLGAALRSLAEVAPVPVVIEELTEERLPAAVETAGYYVVSEALANVTKHAVASRVSIRAQLLGDLLEIIVADDGVGGIAHGRGTGLRGLADRVQALDGTLDVQSIPGRGTTIIARLPVSSEPSQDEEGVELGVEPK